MSELSATQKTLTETRLRLAEAQARIAELEKENSRLKDALYRKEVYDDNPSG